MDHQQQRAGASPARTPAQGGGDFSGILIVLFIFIAFFALIVIPSTPSLKWLIRCAPSPRRSCWGILARRCSSEDHYRSRFGFHFKMPLITQYEPVQVTIQTDQVRDIPCGTKGGVMITFEKIEVVNRLRKDYVYDTLLNYGVQYDNTWIYDKIHHEINQFCSSLILPTGIDEKMKDALQGDCTRYAPGIEIINVRITKPRIPESIRRNFEQMEEERTKNSWKIIAQLFIQQSDCKILMEQKLLEKESARRQQEIDNQMYIAREKSLADADYKVIKEAESNKLKLTPQFLELKFIEAIADNTKIFFGEKVPNMVLDQRLLGNFLQEVSREVSREVSGEEGISEVV
ncbi:hypothetical protein FNV43_RR26726 [Rhamnella rubrinervis]|uniref:Band 7 domain-containing protein n=1 Tax=Rhamnella rubrinervis TaxID=2594499 RepID=A0A8K0DPV8_9ROSA|nr:hypothetical protein FNV43_RR26726 [Rhamnella rubrinervis]